MLVRSYQFLGRAPVRAFLISSTMLAGSASVAHAAAPLPVGGTVAAGNVQISAGANSTTITQSSSRAVVNWDSFNVGAGKSVVFNQPDAQSATLNRVTGGTTSTIAGNISSNGAVYLVNPNGIAITSTGTVNTQGGFVASTLDIADADFMAGKLNFVGNGASSSVSNAGTIAAGQGAYVALLGGAVSNSGTITVPYGKVGLGSGENIALDLNGGGFMQVAVPSNLLTGSAALIENAGSIAASGGTVQLQAAVVKDAVRNVINMSGSINVDSATGDGGTIHLIGGADTSSMAGSVTVSGTLSARATGAVGDGGSIETSGAHLDLNGITVTTASANGTGGNWLLDPLDLTVAASGGDITGAALSAALNTGSVTLVTSATTISATGVTLTGTGSGSNGDININDAVSWTSTNTFTLTAYNNIAITAPITAPAGTLWLAPGQVVAGMGMVTDTASVSVNGFYLNNGTWSQNSAILPSFSATNFVARGSGSTFLRVTGGDGTSGNPYQITDVYGLQGVGSNTLLASNFVLVNDIDASVTATWFGSRDLKGFRPIGEDGYVTGGNGFGFTGLSRSQIGAGFNGSFNGQGHSISNLTINIQNVNPNTSAGLFLTLGTGASISNLNLANETVLGTRRSTIGGLVGTMNDGTVNNVTVGGTVGTSQIAGGLAGQVNGGTVTNSSSSATVSSTGGTGRTVGGLVGILSSGTVSNSYATGSVTLSGGTNPPMEGGGLIGWIKGGTLTQSWASGRVTTDFYSGGLIGYMTGGAVSQVYALGSVVSYAKNTGAGGLVGDFEGGSIDQAYATGYTSITGGVNGGGLIGAGGGQAITNAYWDNFSTLQANPTGAGGSAPTVILITSDPTKSTAANYAYSASTYANFAAAAGIGTATPTGWVFAPGNSTRPLLASEVPTAAVGGTDASGNILIHNSHQLQLIDYNASTLSAHYSLGANIDLTATGAINPASTDPYAFATYTNIWDATGWVPLGTDGAGNILNSGNGFTGSFNGAGFTISNLTISRAAVSYVGLFGYSGSSGTISNVGVIGGSVSGHNDVGVLDGYNGGSVSQSYATGTVTGNASQPHVVGGGLAIDSSFYVGGLVGYNTGTISQSYATDAVTGDDEMGGLVGHNSGMISQSYATGALGGTGPVQVGGLVGVNTGSIVQSYATGAVSSSSSDAGGLVGFNSGPITRSYATGAVAGGRRLGGLVGTNSGGSISQSYATGAVNSPNGNNIGGLVGESFTGSISQSYATGAVSGSYGIYVGGLVGQNYATISQSYATGAVIGGSNVGGLVGSNANSGSVDQSYASGAVSGSTNVGGLIGNGGGTVTNNYWDSYSTGIATEYGNGTAQDATVHAVTSDPAQSNAANYALTASAYANLTASSWFKFDGYRPILLFQADTILAPVNGVVSVNTPFQIALIGADAVTLSQSYTLTGNVTLVGTTPIGTLAAPFSGSFNGGGFTLSGLNINTAANYAGLFGYSTGSISNLSVAGTVTSAGNFVGGVVGYQNGGSITGVTSSVNVTGTTIVGGVAGKTNGTAVSGDTASGSVGGTNIVGGLVGSQIGGTITGSSTSGNVTGSGTFAGGLVGVSWGGTIIGSSATGTVSGVTNVGGLVGYAQGSTNSISNSTTSGGTVSGTTNVGGLVGYAEGSISGSTAGDGVTGVDFVGGLAGRQASGSITSSGATGAVTGGSAAGGQFVGGLIGYQDTGTSVTGSSASGSTGSVSGSSTVNFVGGLIGSAHGTTSGSTASGAVGSSVTDYVGGLVGLQDGADISTSKATGSVMGLTTTGGLVGGVVSGTIDQAYASGAVTGTGAYAGGLIGFLNAGSVTNVYATGPTSGGALFAGGLVGYVVSGTIAQAYATGSVSGGFKTGGLIGYLQGGSLINGVWDIQTSGQLNGAGYAQPTTVFTATGATTLSAQDAANAAMLYLGFDFTTRWKLPNQAGQNGIAIAAYPTLRAVP